MKIQYLLLILSLSFPTFAAGQTPSPTQPAATPVPPPAAAPKRSTADLEKLVAPIALYPDPLIATLLPASVYPLEIVQAARFVANTNNIAKLDEQPWDENVKAVARVPAVIQALNEDISWTIELGEAFLAQDKEVMDAIQSMRGKAQKAGTLQTTPQQIVTVTNMVVEKTVEQQVVVVTNTVVQIQPANPEVVYVPAYNPQTVYYPPPAYVYDPYAPLVTFGVGMAMGAIIANNCDWYHGGCYHGNYNININGDVNINRGNINTGNINSGNRTGNSQKWQPDQNRLNKSGSTTAAASARSAEARGWGSGGASASAARARPSTGTTGPRPSTGSVGARPSPSTPSASSRPSVSRNASQPSPSPNVAPPRSTPSSSSSAFGGTSSGAGARDYSNRGSSSRNSGSFSGSRGGRGGGRR